MAGFNAYFMPVVGVPFLEGVEFTLAVTFLIGKESAFAGFHIVDKAQAEELLVDGNDPA